MRSHTCSTPCGAVARHQPVVACPEKAQGLAQLVLRVGQPAIVPLLMPAVVPLYGQSRVVVLPWGLH